MLWASRMPCATWSWLQGRTNKRRVNHNFLDWPDIRGGAIKGKGGGEGVCIHSLGFIGCLRSDNCSTNPFYCRPSERDIRLRLDGVVDYGLLWWMINRGSLGERGVESSARICEAVDDLLACDVEGGLTLYKDRCSKHREWECECDEG